MVICLLVIIEFLFFSYLFFGRIHKIDLGVLVLYVVLSTLLYFTHLFLMPESFGFSGPYNGIGTDDSRFYSALSDSNNHVPTYARRFKRMEHSFVSFLHMLVPFKVQHPLQIIIPNILGIVFLPRLSALISRALRINKGGQRKIFFLVTICPFILSQGLVLMRDGWVTTFFLLAIYGVLVGRFRLVILGITALVYLRLASAILCILILFLFIYKMKESYRLLRNTYVRFSLAAIFLLIIAFAFLNFGSEYLAEKGVEGFGRQEFVDKTLFKMDSNSTIYKIYSSPGYIKYPAGFMFFLATPFLRFEMFYNGILNVRGILFTFFFPLVNIFIFYGLVKAVLGIGRMDKDRLRLLLSVVVVVFLLSVFSLQVRHKFIVLPLLYILSVLGLEYRNSHIAAMFVIFFTVLQLLFAL